MEDPGVTRRMVFAASFLSPETPNYWEIVANFCSTPSLTLSPQSVKVKMENIQVFSSDFCLSDHELTRALIELECPVTKQTLGIPLISDKNICLSCSGELLLRRDRPGRVTLYTESLGTVLASHYHKYCRNSRKGCKFTQYYGYYKSESGEMYYNEDWNTLPYFLSTQETGFDLEMLRKFDAELLIGQISYKQKADIYNVTKGYDNTKKVCSFESSDKGDHKSIHGYVHQEI